MRLYAYERNESKSAEDTKKNLSKLKPSDKDRKKTSSDIDSSKRPNKMSFAPGIKQS